MATATKTKPRPRTIAEPAPRSPERQRLADAIAVRAAAVAHAAAAVAAVDNARRNAVADRTALAAAKQEVTLAESREADRAIARAEGRPEPTGMTVAEARGVVVAREESNKHHDRAIALLQEKLNDAHRGIAIATDRITECVHAVLRAAPEIRQLYADLAVTTRSRATLFAIACNLPTRDIRPPDIEISDVPDYSIVRLWNGVVDRLMADPDAALPD